MFAARLKSRSDSRLDVAGRRRSGYLICWRAAWALGHESRGGRDCRRPGAEYDRLSVRRAKARLVVPGWPAGSPGIRAPTGGEEEKDYGTRLVSFARINRGVRTCFERCGWSPQTPRTNPFKPGPKESTRPEVDSTVSSGYFGASPISRDTYIRWYRENAR